MIGRLVNDMLLDVPPKYIWGDFLSILNSTDLNLINLETALTKVSQPVPKVFNFRSDPTNVQVLIEGAVTVANLANNHVLDYSESGLIETIETLDKVNIQHIGAGKNAAKAMKPAILERHGIKIGILGCTDNEPLWKASTTHPGTFYFEIGDLEAIENSITQLRPQVDLLIVSIHWGPNMQERPSLQFREFAHQLIALGVDIIHGHSAHIFQGIEVYQKKLILYDTGDFVDDYFVDPFLRNDRSFFFIVEATKQEINSLRCIPARIAHFQVNQAKGKEAEEICHRMKTLSEELHTPLELKNNELIWQP